MNERLRRAHVRNCVNSTSRLRQNSKKPLNDASIVARSRWKISPCQTNKIHTTQSAQHKGIEQLAENLTGKGLESLQENDWTVIVQPFVDASDVCV